MSIRGDVHKGDSYMERERFTTVLRVTMETRAANIDGIIGGYFHNELALASVVAALQDAGFTVIEPWHRGDGKINASHAIK